jgi:3'-phosphoadenosine 5'-phosphosulfate sulfotransferase (PAPS reductase)/FAD synthetase
MDIWEYIRQEKIALPCLYYAHEREVLVRNGVILAVSEFVQPRNGEQVVRRSIRFRTMGDATITAPSKARPQTSTPSSPKLRRPGSPSAATARTTSAAKPQWKTASAKDTFSMLNAETKLAKT